MGMRKGFLHVHLTALPTSHNVMITYRAQEFYLKFIKQPDGNFSVKSLQCQGSPSEVKNWRGYINLLISKLKVLILGMG